jgi:hypothetical protein
VATDHDGPLTTVGNVEVAQLLKRVCAGDVRVKDEKGAVVLCQDLPCQCQRAGCART